MKSIGNLIHNHFARSKVGKSVMAGYIVTRTNEWLEMKFGESSVSHIRAVAFKDGTLIIACSSSIGAQEIKLHETELLDNLIAQINNISIKKVSYRIENPRVTDALPNG